MSAFSFSAIPTNGEQVSHIETSERSHEILDARFLVCGVKVSVTKQAKVHLNHAVCINEVWICNIHKPYTTCSLLAYPHNHLHFLCSIIWLFPVVWLSTNVHNYFVFIPLLVKSIKSQHWGLCNAR